MKYRLKPVSVLHLAALGLFTLPISAATLTFEELPHDAELQGTGVAVISAGYRLNYTPAPNEPYPTGFATVGPSWRFNDGTSALVANSCSARTKLTADDNMPFTLHSIDLDELNGDNDGHVTFIGISADRVHRQIKKTVQLNGTPEWQTVQFPASFANLESVSWKQGDCLTNPPHMFDNIQISPTTNSVLLTFEELPHDAELQGAEAVVMSNGYTLKYAPAPNEPYPTGFTFIGPSWRFNNDGSAALTANSCSAVTTLTADDNSAFSLIAIDLDEFNGDDSGVVTFVGISANRSHQRVKATVHLNGTSDWETFHFPVVFRNLKSVSWTQGDCINNPPHMFDNIRLSSENKGQKIKTNGAK